MSQPKEVEDLTRALIADFTHVWELVLKELDDLEQSWPRTYALREHRLNVLEIKLRELMANADHIAFQQLHGIIESAFTLGALTTNAQAGVVTEAIPISAATTLANDTYQDILTATQHVVQSTKDLIGAIARDEVLMHTYLGQTVEETARKLGLKIAEHRIYAVTYANGAQHGLASYVEMLVRTKTALAYSEGTLQAAEDLDIGFWEILDGPGCGWANHNDPVHADGLIVTTEEARQFPISHPNCRRAQIARPDILTLEDAADAGRLPDDVWESSRAAALKEWEGSGVKYVVGGTAQTVSARYAELSEAQQAHARLIQGKAS